LTPAEQPNVLVKQPNAAVLNEATQSEKTEDKDFVRQLQTEAVQQGKADWGYWGTDPQKYSTWGNHSNRLVPVYIFGMTLESVAGKNSIYRRASDVASLYGEIPDGTVNPQADYFDQTDIYRLQRAAAEAGKRYIILVIFDGMDWHTTWAAAIYRAGEVRYREGRGSGLFFQDYRAVVTDFGCMVTSPHNDGTRADVNSQTVINPGGTTRGGYDALLGGATAWAAPSDPQYLLGRSRVRPHAVTDSAASATSMTAGIKTYNDAINVDWQGRPVETIAHQLQRQGYAIGVVTSVTVSHATPACAYAHNVHRDDYQDIARDLVGLPSVAHREQPLPGVDVLLGAGWGLTKEKDPGQGANFVPGNPVISDEDIVRIDARHGGAYHVVQRTAGRTGRERIQEAAREAITHGHRLLGLFGTRYGHLPFRTADGHFDPTVSVARKENTSTAAPAEEYSEADVSENPTLADLTAAALDVLAARSDQFWLMVEAGDVDWANHANNIDNAIGAVLSGDDAVQTIAHWLEERGAWKDAVVIVTADHGHYFVLTQPERFARQATP